MAVFDFGQIVAVTPRTQAEEKDHWLDRAAAHFDLGQEAEDSRVSWAHLQLAERCLDRVYGESAPAEPELVRIA